MMGVAIHVTFGLNIPKCGGSCLMYAVIIGMAVNLAATACPTGCHCPGNQLICENLEELPSSFNVDSSTTDISISFLRYPPSGLPAGFLSSLNSLTRVQLSGRIGTLNTGAFTSLSSGSTIQKLEFIISNADIHTIKTGAFDGLDRLDLQFLNSKVGIIEQNAFKNLNNFESLKFWRNIIGDIKKGAFSAFRNSRDGRIEVDFSNIQYIREQAFDGITLIGRLDFLNTDIDTVETRAFTQIDRVADITFNRCYIDSLRGNVFANITGNVSLQMTSTDVRCMQENAFHNINTQTVHVDIHQSTNIFPIPNPAIITSTSQKFDYTCSDIDPTEPPQGNSCDDFCKGGCYTNSITCQYQLPAQHIPKDIESINFEFGKQQKTDIEPGLFQNLNNLQSLTFKGRIGNILSDVFDNLPRNQLSITFDGARIDKINAQSFPNINIYRIKFSNSYIGTIKGNAFSGIQNTTIEFQNVNIQSIEKQAFSGNLIKLELKFSRIKEIASDAFSGVLSTLNFNIETCDLSLDAYSFRNMRSVSLQILKNFIRHLGKEAFVGISATDVSIEHNEVVCMSRAAFVGLGTIQNFNFDSILHFNWLPGLANLDRMPNQYGDPDIMYCNDNTTESRTTTQLIASSVVTYSSSQVAHPVSNHHEPPKQRPLDVTTTVQGMATGGTTADVHAVTDQPKSGVPVPLIAGVVAGGTLLLLITVLCVLCCRRRAPRANKESKARSGIPRPQVIPSSVRYNRQVNGGAQGGQDPCAYTNSHYSCVSDRDTYLQPDEADPDSYLYLSGAPTQPPPLPPLRPADDGYEVPQASGRANDRYTRLEIRGEIGEEGVYDEGHSTENAIDSSNDELG